MSHSVHLPIIPVGYIMSLSTIKILRLVSKQCLLWAKKTWAIKNSANFHPCSKPSPDILYNFLLNTSSRVSNKNRALKMCGIWRGLGCQNNIDYTHEVQISLHFRHHPQEPPREEDNSRCLSSFSDLEK